MKSRVRKPEKRWMSASQLLWKINDQIHNQRHSQFHSQFPQFEWVDHQAQEPGVGSRAIETNTDDRETKRVRFTESRGQKRQGEDVEELAAKAEEQHLDADVEVPAHKTWRVEDVVGDAADASPEQINILLDAREQSMNSLVQSKTEVLEEMEESIRPLCMVEDLNDDEVVELCILSNELNASQQYSIHRSLHRVRRSWDFVKVSQWI